MSTPAYIRDLIVERYRDNLYQFFLQAWHVLEPDTPLVQNWHLAYLSNYLSCILMRIKGRRPRTQHSIINIPPSTTKSTLITIVFPVWAWLHDPSLKILSMSYAESLAITHAVKSRDIIQSDWYQQNFGHLYSLKYDVNKKSEFATDRGGVRIAVGVGGAATGKHGDLLLCDDPIDPRRAVSPGEVQTVNDWWDKTISTRMTDAALAHKIIVMQRLGTNDLSGHCLGRKEGQYEHICLPAELTDDVKPAALRANYVDGLLDPVRLNRAVLNDMQTALGSNAYAGQFLQTPIVEEGALVKPEWFRYFDMTEVVQRVDTLLSTPTWHVFIDGAYTEKTLNAPTALLTAALIDNELYIRDVQRVWMELPELVKFIPEYAERNGCNGSSRIIIEPKASGMSIEQVLRRYTRLNVELGRQPRAGKVERFKACLPFIQAGRVRLLSSAGWLDMFLDELRSFPNTQYKDVTDTTVMAIAEYDYNVLSGSLIDMAVL